MSIVTVPTRTGALTGQFVNVKEYGATGDGTTDDTEAIQSALDAIELTGGTLFFPYGTYLISALTYTSAKPIRIVGEIANLVGPTTNLGSWFVASAGSNTMLHIDGSTNYTGCTIERMGFLGNGAYNSLIGVHVESRWQTTIRDCMFNEFDGTSSVAIKLVGSSGKLTITSLVDRCRIRDATTGILIDYVTSPSIRNCYIANCKTLIDASTGNGDTLSVVDCQLDGGSVTAATAISCNLKGSRIIGNRFELTGDDYGVTFGTSAYNSSVVCNWFYGALTCVTIPSGCTNAASIGNQYESVTNLVINSDTSTIVADSRVGVTQRSYVSLTGNTTLTADQSGFDFYLDAEAGFTVTLPAPQQGLRYRFFVSTLLTGSATYKIITSGSPAINRLQSRGLWNNNSGTMTIITWATASPQDTITFNDGAESVGDWVEVESNGYWWFVQGFCQLNGGITASVDV